jgi:hypothetical protein
MSNQTQTQKPTTPPTPARKPRFVEQMDYNMSNSRLDMQVDKNVAKTKSFEDFVPAGKLSTWGKEDEKKREKKVLARVVRSLGGK